MKYVDEFRDLETAEKLSAAIHAAADTGRAYNFMEFCGGHTHALSRFGLESLLPENITMIHGPGCPVCVLPIGRLDMAADLALAHPDIILTTYGDMMRVPGTDGRSLIKAKALGADVRMVYSPLQTIELAKANPDRHVVFFAIGFETTTPPTAAAIMAAEAAGLKNFSVFCNHVLTPAAINAIMSTGTEASRAKLDGFVGPGNVSTIIGAEAYDQPADQWQKPIVISGFEPNDLLDSILRLVIHTNEGSASVENRFDRAVLPGGNQKAQALTQKVFALRDTFEWRGLGSIPDSALRVADRYSLFDTEQRYQMTPLQRDDHKACACAQILRGEMHPRDCKVFGQACTPEHPLGSCMVSSEGACAAHYQYGRFRDAAAAKTAAE